MPLDDPEEKDIMAADLNKDGWVDVVVVRKVPFSIPGARQDLLLMNESGVLIDRTQQYAPGFSARLTDARDVVAVDVDGDTWTDLVIANTFDGLSGDQRPALYRNRGNDAFGAWLGLADESFRIGPIGMSPIRFCGVSAGDIDAVGGPDLFFSNYNGGVSDRDVLMINQGPGCFASPATACFTDETVARMGSFASVSFGTANDLLDVDNDGDKDIVKVDTKEANPPAVWYLYNNGTGQFTTRQAIPVNQPYMFVTADFNGDGKQDTYVVQDPQDQVDFATTIVPNSSVSFTVFPLSQSPRTTGFGGNAHAADIDGDGDRDLGVGPIDVDIPGCNRRFALLQNPGNGQLFDPWTTDQNIHLVAHDFAFLDINRDGCQDIFMGLCSGWKVFIRSCAAGGGGGGCGAPSSETGVPICQ